MNGTIVCGVDETDEGRAALDHAVELARRLEMRLVVAHVGEVKVPFSSVAGDGMQDDVYWREREAAILLVDRVAREAGLAPDVERRVSLGDPTERIAQVAADEAADLVIVGARRRGRLRPRMDCGFAERLQQATGVPVLVASTPLPDRSVAVAA